MKKASLKSKIWLCIGMLVAACVVSTSLSIHRAIQGRASMHYMLTKLVKQQELLADIRDSQRRLMINLFEVISRDDKETSAKHANIFQEAKLSLEQKMKAFYEIAPPERATQMQTFEKSYRGYMAVSEKAIALGLANHGEEAKTLAATADADRDVMRKMTVSMNEEIAEDVARAAGVADAEALRAIWISLFVAVSSILGGCAVSYVILRQLSKEMGDVVRVLSESSQQVSSAAGQIASSSETLSQATTEQAASLEETAASVEEMNSMVAKNVDNARATEQTSHESQKAVAQGKEIVVRMIAAMDQIGQASRGLADTVKVIAQIEKKTQVINEIVNKTELLSFNASVEAARAGEHGKGFAVVAEEVGNLARLSGAAAEEIAALLETSTQRVNEMVAVTNRSVEHGTEITRECGSVFDQIVGQVDRVSNMASEISQASQEQARGTNEITKAMSQLDQMTQQNAATSEECAASADELSNQARLMQAAVTRLVATVEGGGAVAEAALATPAPAAPSAKVLPLNRESKTVARQVGRVASSGSTPVYEHTGFTDI